MNDLDRQARTGHRLIQLGVVLFLVGLLTGFVGPNLANPRMALASHLEGVMNGILLIVLGLLWPRLAMRPALLTLTFWLALYGTFANWSATLLAAAWGAGASMPIAAGELRGTSGQEVLIDVLLFSLSFAMIAVSVLLLWGLRGGAGGPDPAGR